jgi:hypothetical protein
MVWGTEVGFEGNSTLLEGNSTLFGGNSTLLVGGKSTLLVGADEPKRLDDSSTAKTIRKMGGVTALVILMASWSSVVEVMDNHPLSSLYLIL